MLPNQETQEPKRLAYFGKESSEYLTTLIAGKRVRLEYDVGHFDKYGRILAYVYLEDGTFVNANMVKNGYATVMTVPPNVKYADTFLKLERKARNRNKGMWGDSPSQVNLGNLTRFYEKSLSLIPEDFKHPAGKHGTVNSKRYRNNLCPVHNCEPHLHKDQGADSCRLSSYRHHCRPLHAFHWSMPSHEIELMAQIGVVLLLFTIGMEFSLQHLLKIRRIVFLVVFCR